MADYYADLYPSVKESDLFVSSILGYVAPLLAKTTGTRWVNALLSPMALWSAFEPPVLPPVSFFRFLWGKSPKLNRLLLNTIFKSFESMGEPMQLLREQVGLPRINLYREGQHSSPLLLCLWSPLFGAPQPDWPKEAETPGFVFYDPKLSSPLSTELESFLNNSGIKQPMYNAILGLWAQQYNARPSSFPKNVIFSGSNPPIKCDNNKTAYDTLTQAPSPLWIIN
jgi:hypothetical protein